MAALERTYTIPLRKEWAKVPKYKRAKKAVIAVKRFLSRHMKSPDESVSIGKDLNEALWQHGIRNPPAWISVDVVKSDDGKVTANLVGAKAAAGKKSVEKKEVKTEKKESHKSKELTAEVLPVENKELKIEQQVKEVIKEKTKDKAVKKGEAKIKKEMEKLQKVAEKKD